MKVGDIAVVVNPMYTATFRQGERFPVVKTTRRTFTINHRFMGDLTFEADTGIFNIVRQKKNFPKEVL